MEQKHWLELLKEAEALKEQQAYEEAYAILRKLYEQNTFRYDKIIHASYEDYIENKVAFFVDLAKLSMRITNDAAQSIPYIDEALIMMDASESISPFVSMKAIEELKESYEKQVK